MRIIGIGALLLLTIGTSHAEVGDDAAWIEAARAKYNIPGVSIAIVQRDQPTRFYSAGLCNVERAIPCTAQHRLPLGSVTKSITGLLAATLASEQRIDLDIPAIRYWPQIKLPDDRASQITLRDLLTQQGGLGAVDWPYNWDLTLTREDYLARLPLVPLAGPFRAGFAYANANFILGGKVLEEATGSTWESLVTERLLSPLGMSNSGFDAPAELTIGYGPATAGRLEPFPYLSPHAIRPAGGLVTTATDFSRLIAMVLGEGKFSGSQIVPAAAIRTALSTGNTGKRGGYGLGLAFTRFRDQLVFHHLGSMAGYSAAVLILPGRWGVIVLTNRTGSTFPEGLSFALLDRQLGNTGDDTLKRLGGPTITAAAPETAGVIAPPASAIADFTGFYRHAAWGEFAVESAGTQLRIRLGSFAASLDSAGGESFSFLTAPGWERISITFQRDAGGRVTGFLMADGMNKSPQPFTKFNMQSRPRTGL